MFFRLMLMRSTIRARRIGVNKRIFSDATHLFEDCGAPESEGITENVESWRSDIATKFVTTIGLDHLMFEAAAPEASRVTTRFRSCANQADCARIRPRDAGTRRRVPEVLRIPRS
jgi:phosphosulfolactate synthase (CoM biosynthesis protein A)